MPALVLVTGKRGPGKLCDCVKVFTRNLPRLGMRDHPGVALLCSLLQRVLAACVHEPFRPHPEHEAILGIRRERFLHAGWNKAALACCSWFKRSRLAHPCKMQRRPDWPIPV